MSGRDDESCDIMQHHATPCDQERKRVGSGWRKTSFVRRHCGRGTRWRERERKAGGRRKRKGFPLQYLLSIVFGWMSQVLTIEHPRGNRDGCPWDRPVCGAHCSFEARDILCFLPSLVLVILPLTLLRVQ